MGRRQGVGAATLAEVRPIAARRGLDSFIRFLQTDAALTFGLIAVVDGEFTAIVTPPTRRELKKTGISSTGC